MADFFEERTAQNRAKHEILRRYAGGWSGIILAGLSGRVRRGLLPRGFGVHLVFIDGFAGAGRYGRDADKDPPGPGDEPIWGSPVIGLRELEAQARHFSSDLAVTVSGVIVERDEQCYDCLVDNMRDARLKTQVVSATGFSGHQHGSILVIQGDFRDYIDDLLRWTGADPYVLALIDPYGPAMDLGSMRKILERERTDTIALFPYDDLKRRGGSALKPEEDWGPSDRGNITRFDAHFGTPAWRSIYEKKDLSPEEREADFVRLYTHQLESLDPRNTIKTIGLRYAHAENRTAYYLCMTTRDAYGALKFNDIMREAAAAEDLEIWRDREAMIRREDEATGQSGLFDLVGGLPGEPPTSEKYRAKPEDVERALLEHGVTPRPITYRNLLQRMSASIFIESEIQSALRKLRREGRAEFSGSRFKAALPVWIKPAA